MTGESIDNAPRLEQRLAELFFQLPIHLKGTYKTIQVMQDDNFVHRRDRTSNDLHAFFELYSGEYFHLRGYTRHMLQQMELAEKSVFLTGYRKREVSLIGGTHSLRQDWYRWDSESVAQEILKQNPDIFPSPK